MTRALYPGSFDPITYGHIDIARRARKLFDELIVGVFSNPNKRTLFPLEERKKLVKRALKEEGLADVKVIGYTGLLIECAKELEVEVVIRGLRVNSDFDYEFQIALTNRDLDSTFETVFLMTSRDYVFLSSSMVKEIKAFGGDVSRFVPRVVEEALERKLQPVARKESR
ncbi:MAG: pantetheine-phosphate adenylyltransferase [Candidatus Acetothermia bacterium]|nr:pantetheine-phosphate adenylyltransferase [Candidatus Acetothermia bacterium]MDH7505150.1 pantetheine-phosphate adenylyltransferase [Candidatus Acetothermia bacterium]